MQSAVTDLFSSFLRSHGFMEIHSPKLQGAATESGASVFKVSYFKGIWYYLVLSSSFLMSMDRRRFPCPKPTTCKTNVYRCRYGTGFWDWTSLPCRERQHTSPSDWVYWPWSRDDFWGALSWSHGPHRSNASVYFPWTRGTTCEGDWGYWETVSCG